MKISLVDVDDGSLSRLNDQIESEYLETQNPLLRSLAAIFRLEIEARQAGHEAEPSEIVIDLLPDEVMIDAINALSRAAQDLIQRQFIQTGLWVGGLITKISSEHVRSIEERNRSRLH